jgi:diguanylate cyclase (GGDEF)-like protein/PAS domain S-box-containing protein
MHRATGNSQGQDCHFKFAFKSMPIEKRLNKSINVAKSYRSLVENISDYAIFMLDKKGKVLSWDKGASIQLGYTNREIIGKSYSMFFTQIDIKAELPAFDLKEARILGRHIDERLYVRKNGKEYWGTAVLTSTTDKKGVHQGFSMIMRDVTEEKNLQQIIMHRSTHDYLTGLPNRRIFEQNLLECINKNKKNNLCAILFLDFNNFKHVNDKQGHGFGDLVLVQIAARLLKGIRAADMVARLGGDEFVILASGFTDAKDIKLFAEKIIRIFQMPFKIGKKEITTTVSIGISLYPNDSNKASQLLHYSDMALYEAKKNGGNQFWFYRNV